jgi:hypothetical protein
MYHYWQDNFSKYIFVVSLLWKDLVPPKIKVFIWQLMHNSLWTREFLSYKHITSHQQASCPFCDCDIESYKHLFLHCLEPWKLWSRLMNWLRDLVVYAKFIWSYLATVESFGYSSNFIVVLWNSLEDLGIWMTRNNMVF